MKRPIITLLTDFGLMDHYAAAMKGVMLCVCPDAQLVDLSHEVTPYAVAEGAYILSQAWRVFPQGTVHLVVVDPGVGSVRRPILAEAAGHYFVAPDNGVLSMVYDAAPSHQVRAITASRYFRQPVSRTFHGRDIFAPVAAQVASGVAAGEFGAHIEDYLRLPLGAPIQTGPNTWTGTILKVDRFGNAITNFQSEAWTRLVSEPFELRVGEHIVSVVAENYAGMETGHLFVIPGSAGFLEISLNRGNAANQLGVKSGDAVKLTVRPDNSNH